MACTPRYRAATARYGMRQAAHIAAVFRRIRDYLDTVSLLGGC